MIITFKIMVFVSKLRCKHVNVMTNKVCVMLWAGCSESNTYKMWSKRVTAELPRMVLVSFQVNATLNLCSVYGAKVILFWPIRSVVARLLELRMTQNGVELPPGKNLAKQNIAVYGLLCVWCRPAEPLKPAETSVTVFSTSSLIIPTEVYNAQCFVSSIHIILND
jgi:hypothetical protein